METRSLKEDDPYPSKMNTLVDNLLEFYGARTSGSYERKLERAIRFIKTDSTVYQTVVVPTTQSESGMKGVKRDRNGESIASRTRSSQPVAARTRSQTQH